jgi:succinate-semialdehyde dehydrogenase / glutarate-semialdehyde dehydrogenase
MCGPLINSAAVAKVSAHVSDAIAKGGRIVVGGSTLKDAKGLTSNSGLFYKPTVITGANTSMQVFAEETFGPVAFLFAVTFYASITARCVLSPTTSFIRFCFMCLPKIVYRRA